jgi:glutathione S-transferase
MVLKLYGSPYSTCTARVAIVLHEKKIPYELVPIDLAKGQQKAAEFVAVQPFGQVPYIVEDDGFTLYESRAICRYLAIKYPDQGTPNLIPHPTQSDIKSIALFEQAASIEVHNFDVFASRAGFEAFIKKARGMETDQAVVDASVKMLEAKLDGYEVILGKQKYLGGDQLTLVDLFHLPYGAMLAKFGCNLMTTKGPNITRWWNDITSRASWQAVKDGTPKSLNL